jgi:hypothetical protein
MSGGSLALSWPVASADFTLVSGTNLASGTWTTVSPSPQIVSNQWQVTVPVSGNTQFFWLVQ